MTLRTGEQRVATGSNDVGRKNRGLFVQPPEFGQLKVKWPEFQRLDLLEAPPGPAYDAFDGGRRLAWQSPETPGPGPRSRCSERRRRRRP